ncbi:MAG: GAF domain-containing protein [Chloroflexi bacterium]|nr:GAF domain-containing protein [Chloroflexota bacterium]
MEIRDSVQFIGRWGLLFIMLVLAIWAATQSRDAPQLILLTVLTLIAINFSLPPSLGNVGVLPIVSITTFLVMGLPTAVILLIIGLLLAELSQPLWQPLWEMVPRQRPSWQQRFMTGLIHLLSLLAAGYAFNRTGGVAPFTATTLENLTPLLALAAVYGGVYFWLNLVSWLAQSWSLSIFFRDAALPLFMAGFLAQLFAILGGITYTLSGLPAFVLFCLGVAVFSVIIWLSWQRRYSLEQHLNQFALLNSSGHSLRETLDLPDVLTHAADLVSQLVTVDQFTINLLNEDSSWSRNRWSENDQLSMVNDQLSMDDLDDFSRWVVSYGRVLDLDPTNMPFAARHNLTPPTPTPAIWLGLPLLLGSEVIGVMSLQRFEEARPYTRWQLEMLRSAAAQASSAIHNARLHGEIVQLYTQTDEALAQRVKQLQALLNGMTEGVLMIDRHGRVALINPMAQQLFKEVALEPGQFLDTADHAPRLGYKPPHLTDQLANLAAGTIHCAAQPYVYELAAAEGDGRPRLIERQEAPIYDRSDQLLGWLLLFRDVTAAQELAERREDLTRMIVHDLRNPLTTISSAVQIALNRLPTDGRSNNEVNSLLQDAHTGSLDLLDMVDSLMDINRMEAGQSIVDADAMRLPPLVAKVGRRLQPLLDHKQITLTIEAAPDLPPVWADEELVRRILVNLLDNGLKFTPANGRITILMQPEPADASHEPGVRCIIQDSGPGIPLDFHDQLFDRYMRTNIGGAPVRGAGLGLTFCKMALEGQNGRIWANDAPDQGTQFIFTLPGIPLFNGQLSSDL